MIVNAEKILNWKKNQTKKYVSDVIGLSFVSWENKKIIINAPTGSGKTTFILASFIPYVAERGEKTLILCNRKLLRYQYWYSAVKTYKKADYIENAVEIMTYQNLAAKISENGEIATFLQKFDHIVCDECHYFYSDTLFNGFDTFILLQELILDAFRKNIIFISATMDEIYPFITEYIERAYRKYSLSHSTLYADYMTEAEKESIKKDFYKDYKNGRILSEKDLHCKDVIAYGDSLCPDYSHIKCFAVPDNMTLCHTIAKSEGKSLVFIDDKKKAEEYRQNLKKLGLTDDDINVLNADILDDAISKKDVESLAMANRLNSKVLLTTSVLDNGISIHDPEVKNVIIITHSKTSFIQMLGRIRSETTEGINLFFLLKSSSEYAKYEEYWGKLSAFIDKIDNEKDFNSFSYLQTMLKQNHKTETEEYFSFLHSEFVLINSSIIQHLLPEDTSISGEFSRRNMLPLVRNTIAEAKIKQSHVTLSLLHSEAAISPEKAIYVMMEWIGKSPDELSICGSTHTEQITAELSDYLIEKIDNVNYEDLNRIKKDLSELYYKELKIFLPEKDIRPKKNLGREAMIELCNKLNLKYDEWIEKGHKKYSVKRI